MAAWLAAALGAAVLSGCGQRGPLYLPSPPPAATPAQPAAPAQPSPVPAANSSPTSR
ncbi:MAG TPA: lipoprotein [Paucimonas sp.]|nr:lipoprotein [Paucimonas sp.]